MAIVWVYAMVRVDPTLSTLTIDSARPPGSGKSVRQIGQKFMPWLTSWISATMCTVTALVGIYTIYTAVDH